MPSKPVPARTAGHAISRMPRPVRDEISRALVDGATWKDIRDLCKKHGFPGIRAQNVTNYRKNAHKEWLAREERLESLRRSSEQTRDAVRFYAEHGGSPAEAGLIAAAEMLSKALIDQGPDTMKQLIADDPKAVLGMMRELSRLSELLRVKGKDARQDAATPESTPALTPEQRAAAMKEIFGLPA